jgi:hypothetical protein
MCELFSTLLRKDAAHSRLELVREAICLSLGLPCHAGRTLYELVCALTASYHPELAAKLFHNAPKNKLQDFWNCSQITYTEDKYYGNAINKALGEAENDIREFIFDQVFKVGSGGVLRFFCCVVHNAAVVVFEKHFAFVNISIDDYMLDDPASKQDFSCVSLLQGKDKVDSFLTDVNVEDYEWHEGKQKMSGIKLREYLISLASEYLPAPPVYEGARFCLLCMKKIPAVGL